MNKKQKLKKLNEELKAIQVKKREGHSWSQNEILSKREAEIQDEIDTIINSLKPTK